MAVTQQQTVFSYVASGGTVFAFGCRVLAQDDLVVLLDGVEQSTSVFTVSGLGNSSGGTVTFNAAPVAGALVRILRATQIERTTDYQIGGDFEAPTVNLDFDRVYMLAQDILGGSVDIANVLRVPAGETLLQLPPLSERAGKLLTFDPVTGDPQAIAAASQDATSVAIQLGEFSALGGSGKLGHDMALAYAANTVGFKLKGIASICDVLNGVAGAVADGSIVAGTGTDNSAAIQARIDHLGVGGALFIPPGNFLCKAQIQIPSQFTLYGAGKFGSVLHTTNSFNADGLLKCNGIGGAPTNVRDIGVVAQNGGAGASSKGINVVANGTFVSDVWVNGFNVNATLASSDNFLSSSALEEPAAGGTCLEISSTDVTVSDVVLYHGYIGCAIHDIAFLDGTVSLSNVRADACTYDSYLISNANNVMITGCSAGGSNVGQNAHAAMAVSGSSNIVISGFIARTGGGPSTTASGIDLTGAGNSSIAISNTQLVGWMDGLTAVGVSGLALGNVSAVNSYRNGISVSGGDRLNIGNCQAINDGSAGAATDAGFKLNSTEGSAVWTITGCTSTQNGGGQQDFGFDVSLTDNGANTGVITLTGNTGRFNSVADLRLQGAVGSIRLGAGNSFGTSIGGLQTLGAIAGMTLPPGQDTIFVSGNGTITSIAPSWPDRVVRLIFVATAGVQDGGNLKLAGNFVGTADDVLSLVCDGTNWYEISRTVN